MVEEVFSEELAGVLWISDVLIYTERCVQAPHSWAAFPSCPPLRLAILGSGHRVSGMYQIPKATSHASAAAASRETAGKTASLAVAGAAVAALTTSGRKAS